MSTGFFILFISPIASGIQKTFGNFDKHFVLFNQTNSIEPIKIETLTLMNVVKKEDIPYREIDIDKQEEIKVNYNFKLSNNDDYYLYSISVQ